MRVINYLYKNTGEYRYKTNKSETCPSKGFNFVSLSGIDLYIKYVQFNYMCPKFSRVFSDLNIYIYIYIFQIIFKIILFIYNILYEHGQKSSHNGVLKNLLKKNLDKLAQKV